MRCLFGLLAGFMSYLAAIAPGSAADASLVTIETPRGVRQAFILIKPAKPVAAVILFAGGRGALGLQSATAMRRGRRNFLVRSRQAFAVHGLLVAVIDTPSDHPEKVNARFRMSDAHAADIAAVASYLKKVAPLPVWLVGTSMGTFSAANGAIAAKGIHGLVLSSTVTHAFKRWKISRTYPDGVASMDLSKVRLPTLIVAHKDDACPVTPPAGVEKLKARLRNARPFEIAMLTGGRPPKSRDCKALSQHGYFGIEDKAVASIARFVKANSR